VLLIETSFETLYEGQALFGDIWERLQSWGFDFRENLDEAYAPDVAACFKRIASS
jgi:hypothetical protein